MDQKGSDFLRLMFRPGETVCVSHNKYGYHSIPLENAINGPVVLVSPDIERGHETPDSAKLTLVALNPIKGFRQDANCTAFRNFLIEMDEHSLTDQIAYIKKLGMPYSAVVFSGNKSLHYLIALSMDLPNEKIYRFFSEWILNIVTLADQNTKNPSRSIRIPDAYREEDKKQRLVEQKSLITIQELTDWLNKFPNCKPEPQKERVISENPEFQNVKKWVSKKLKDGIFPPNRNKQWFTVAVEFALAGYSEDDTISALLHFYQEDRDFKQKEWETTIKSAFKWTYERKE